MNLTVSATALDTLSRSAAPATAAGRHSIADPSQVTLLDSERQPCEVWTRVMGYHRPVSSFNVGKQGEHAERKFFRAA